MTLTTRKNLIMLLIASISILFVSQIPSLQARSSYMAEEMRLMDSRITGEDNYYYN